MARDPEANGPEPDCGGPPKIRIPSLYGIYFPFTRVVVEGLFTLLGGWHVEGEEYIPPAGGVLIAPNHVSYADPPAIGLAMRRRCWFMAKEPLFHHWFSRWLFSLYLAFPVKVDGAMDRAALRHTECLLQAGEAVCIYPEGSVSRKARLQPLQPGLALIALRTGVPIVPAAITGTQYTVSLPDYLPRFRRGGTRVRFGPPIDPSIVPPGLSRRGQADWLTARLDAAIRALLPPEYLPEEDPPAV